jgi:hypothetical protein
VKVGQLLRLFGPEAQAFESSSIDGKIDLSHGESPERPLAVVRFQGEGAP